MGTPKTGTNQPPRVVEVVRTVSGKIVLKNNSKEKNSIELFNRIHANFIGEKDSYSPATFVTGKVTIKTLTGKYSQTYSEFFESVLHTSIVISNVTTTNNKQINFFRKDLVMGRKPVSEEWMKSSIDIAGRTIMQIELRPKQKFEINFVINMVEAEMKHMRGI